jgi:hypothetical protein
MRSGFVNRRSGVQSSQPAPANTFPNCVSLAVEVTNTPSFRRRFGRQLETIAASKPFSRMADHWTEQLRCPTCHRTGTAALSQEDDDDIPTADSIPDGFEVITTSYGIDFICSSCRIRVEP